VNAILEFQRKLEDAAPLPARYGAAVSRTSVATRRAAIEGDPRWRALLARDPSADGAFFYSVETTGVYCYPSCAARTPRPEHVAWHDSRDAAEGAGYRPCKRCRPQESPPAVREARRVEALCRFIEASDTPPALGALAEHVGLSPAHTHRMFKRVTGVTPRAYAATGRAEKMRAALRASNTVTEAVYAAGYEHPAPFYAASRKMLGMTPSTFRTGGDALPIRFAVGQCSLGAILVAATELGVCAVSLGDDPDALVRALEQQFPRAQLVGADAEFEALVARVVGLVEDPHRGEALPLHVRGTAFQRRVWEALTRIPAGRTVTYAELASLVGRPGAARAVARACASNEHAVLIPCHRVVRSDGEGGYRWGIARKRSLLSRE
jgi:AraC family transcriptional regulator of adaptative response/methylated-DNA-[protein]-cysteine methyltransferase